MRVNAGVFGYGSGGGGLMGGWITRIAVLGVLSGLGAVLTQKREGANAVKFVCAALIASAVLVLPLGFILSSRDKIKEACINLFNVNTIDTEELPSAGDLVDETSKRILESRLNEELARAFGENAAAAKVTGVDSVIVTLRGGVDKNEVSLLLKTLLGSWEVEYVGG